MIDTCLVDSFLEFGDKSLSDTFGGNYSVYLLLTSGLTSGSSGIVFFLSGYFFSSGSILVGVISALIGVSSIIGLDIYF